MIENLSVVIPALNEEESIPKLLDELYKELGVLNIDYEIILIDDGSKNKLENFVTKNDKLKIIRNNIIKGQGASIFLGIKKSNFRHICLLDGDGQNPPSEIKKLISLYNNNEVDVVAGIRVNRSDNQKRKKISRLANFFVRKITKTQSEDIGCSLKIFDKKIVEDIKITGDIHRILTPLLEMRGYTIRQVDVDHKKREHGKTNYSYNRAIPVLIDAFLLYLTDGFIKTPRYALGKLSFYFFVGSFFSFAISLFQKLYLDVFVHRNPIFLIGITLFFVSIQLFIFSVGTLNQDN